VVGFLIITVLGCVAVEVYRRRERGKERKLLRRASELYKRTTTSPSMETLSQMPRPEAASNHTSIEALI